MKSKILKLSPIPFQNLSVKYNDWLLLLLIPLIGLGYFVLRYFKNKPSVNLSNLSLQIFSSKTIEPNEVLPENLYLKLLNSTQTILNSDELDEILSISRLEPDSKKLRRHRLLVELEKTNPGFITRIKDSDDKRRFTYSINKSEL